MGYNDVFGLLSVESSEMATPENTILLNEFIELLNPQVDLVGYHQSKPGWKSEYENSISDLFRFWYISEGTGSVCINNQWLNFAANDLVTIKPGRNYTQEKSGRKNPSKIYYIYFYPFGSKNIYSYQNLFNSWPKIIMMKYHPEVKALFQELFEIFTTKHSSSKLLIKSIMLRILHIIIDAYKNRPQEITTESYSKLLMAKDYIYNHYNEPLTLDQISDNVNLSSSYLSALFTKHLNTSPINYQITLKLRSAKLLLAKGEPVTKVSDKVGFNSIHHFSRIFKKHFGMSPSQFAMIRRKK